MTNVSEPAADRVLANRAGHVAQRDVVHRDAAVAGVRVELAVEAVGHLEHHGPVARGCRVKLRLTNLQLACYNG